MIAGVEAAWAFFGSSYPPEFSLLLVCELRLPTEDGTLMLDSAGPVLGGLLADFANAGFDVANVGWHGEHENVVERTAYCTRVRGG